MALIKCEECGNAVSERAGKCPGCGAPIKPPKKRTSVITWVIATIFAGGILAGLASHDVTGSPAKVNPADAKKEAQFQTMVAAIRAVKASTKNPDSFRLDDAILISDDTMCITFHGTNSFNAIVPGHAVIVPSKNVASDANGVWNKFCGGKTGTDLSSAKFAL